VSKIVLGYDNKSDTGKKHASLVFFLSTILGLAICVEYVKFSQSNFVHFVVSFSLLCTPVTYMILKTPSKSLNITFAISLILLTIFFGQYLIAFKSNYVEGTDAPFHFQRAVSLLDESGKFQLYNESMTISRQFFGLYLFVNILSILLNKSISDVCLYVCPLFGILSGLVFLLIIKSFYPTKMALIACILACWSITFVGYGIELRPENMGILFLLIILFTITRKHKENYISYFIITIITGFAVIVSHSVSTSHVILILSIYAFINYYVNKLREGQYIPVIIFIAFITYLIYISGSFGQAVIIFSDTAKCLFGFKIGQIFESKGFVATTAGTLSFLIIWFERFLFLVGFFMLIQRLRIKSKTETSPFNYFIFLWASVYLMFILALILAHSLNPGRFYRVFAFPAAIIESFPLFSLISNSKKSFIQIKFPVLRFVGVLLIMELIMMNSLLVRPNWIINTQINGNRDKPYADISDQDMCAARFANHYINQVKLAGGFRTALIFGAFGDKEIVRLDYVFPNKKIVEEDDIDYIIDKPLFIDLRSDHRKYINYGENIIKNSLCVYNNQQVLINLLE